MLKTDADAPLHSVIRNDLLAEITSGRLQPGDQVPTEPALMERFGVSRTTVRRALRDLETMNLIVRQPGRGSFVSEPRLEPRLDRLTGFVEDMDALGLSASAKVITIDTGSASKEVATGLGIRPGAPVVHIERVRLGNGQPISFDDSYLPAELGSRIAEENLEVDPFYSILEEKYGLALAGADYVVESSSAGERVADLLGIEQGAPVLLIERTSYTTDSERPALFEHLYFRGDRMRYRLRLNR